MTALFAALACVATMSIRIPTPGTSGYIHPGDAIVILAGIILGPVYGMLAGGIGSALSDLIGGYFVYVPITLVIKGLVALVSGLIYQKMCRSGKKRYIAVILGGITDIVFVAGGYFICEFFLYGSGAAASIPANIIQGVGGLIISAVLYPVLIAIPDVRQAAYEAKNSLHLHALLFIESATGSFFQMYDEQKKDKFFSTLQKNLSFFHIFLLFHFTYPLFPHYFFHKSIRSQMQGIRMPRSSNQSVSSFPLVEIYHNIPSGK